MGELAQLPWWQKLKWRRRRRRLQQLPARGFGGDAGRLGCTVPSPARGPVCWGGACKNPRGARDGLTEGAGVRGQRARSKGSRLGTWVWEAVRAGPEGQRGSHRALLSLKPKPGFCTLSVLPRLPGATPTRGPTPGLGARGAGARTPLVFTLLPQLLVALVPSDDPERDSFPVRLPECTGCWPFPGTCPQWSPILFGSSIERKQSPWKEY